MRPDSNDLASVADLAAVLALIVAADAVVLSLTWTPVRVLAGLLVVVFLPGYALTAALFPRDKESHAGIGAPRVQPLIHRIDRFERIALATGLSVALVGLTGIGLDALGYGVRLGPVLAVVTAITVVALGVAAYRRWRLKPVERFSVAPGSWPARLRAAVAPVSGDLGRQWNLALNLLLVASVLLAAGGVAFAVTGGADGFTTFFLLNETEDGHLTADSYPTEFERGESRSVVVGIQNREGHVQNYTVVIQFQRIDVRDGETVVLERHRLGRFRATVEPGETWYRGHTVTPPITGTDHRLVYLLYRGEPPSGPTTENAYRDVHLRVNVTA